MKSLENTNQNTIINNESTNINKNIPNTKSIPKNNSITSNTSNNNLINDNNNNVDNMKENIMSGENEILSNDLDIGTVYKGNNINNIIAFFILSTCIYFPENYFSALSEDLVGAYTGILVCSLHLPKLIIKVMGLFFLNKINYKLRVFITAILFLIAFLLCSGLLFWKPKTDIANINDDRNRLIYSLIIYSISAMSMAIGEITILGRAGYYDQSCVTSWSSGSGFGGFVAGVLKLFLSKLEHKLIYSTGICGITFFFLLIFAFFILLKQPIRQVANTI